ncbi:MAG: ABC transporter permease [Streptococcaceae bacterium]|jgi:ABC-2 type transport system permease protein|nr:ABC transporter permease [Streptococcaceae bacterium]
MKKILILFKKDLLELWRTKKILILSLVFILFALSSPVLAYYTPEILKSLGASGMQIAIPKATIYDSYDQFYKNIGQIGLFVLIIVISGLIVNERRRGQFTSLLNNGVNKAQFVLSKIVSQVLVFSLIYLLAIACFSIYNIVLFDKNWLAHSFLSLLLIYVYFFFVICLTNFFSSWMKNMVLTLVLSLAITIFMGLFSMFKFGSYLPSYLPNLATSVLHGKELTNAYQTMGISCLVSLALVVLAAKLCSNRE